MVRGGPFALSIAGSFSLGILIKIVISDSLSINRGMQMKKVIMVVGFAMMSLGLGGCATVLNGTNQEVGFMSDPDGAVVKISTGQTCTTPCEYSMKRGKDLRVDFNLEDYQPEYVYVQSRLGGSTFGNIIMGGGIGAVVDGSNGASNNLYPRPVYIRLVPLEVREIKPCFLTRTVKSSEPWPSTMKKWVTMCARAFPNRG